MGKVHVDNKKFYIISSSVSLIFIIFSTIFKNDVIDIFGNIGYSVVAASLMAIFIDWNNNRSEEKHTLEARRYYFSEINKQYINLIAHMIWLGDRLDDPDFNWKLPDEDYFTLTFMMDAERKYKSETMDYSKAKDRLLKQSKRYPYEAKGISDEEKTRILKMFSILECNSQRLICLLKNLKKDILSISSLGFLKIEQVNDIIYNLQLIEIELNHSSYSAVVREIISSYEIIRNACNYNDQICVGPNGIVYNV